MRKIKAFLILLLLPFFAYGQIGKLKMRIYLVGDAGEMENGSHPVLEDLANRLPNDSATITHLIYLGDNIYPFGMPEETSKTRKQAESILDAQLGIWPLVSGKIWMVPGNHDWEKGKPDGWNAVLRAQKFAEENFPQQKVMWLPKDACPGPVPIDLNDNALLILLDSQWWLHKHIKPENGSDCTYKTKEEVLAGLAILLEENKEKTIVVAMHHPMKSFGPHNGGYNWRDHIFPLTALNPNLYVPLPVLGSIHPLYRTWFGSVQDIPNPNYQEMILALEHVFSKHPSVIYVAGHEHGLFYFRENGKHYVVSGSGAKNTTIKKKNTAEFTNAHQGYAFLDFYHSKRITLSFLKPGDVTPIYKVELFSSVEKDRTDTK